MKKAPWMVGLLIAVLIVAVGCSDSTEGNEENEKETVYKYTVNEILDTVKAAYPGDTYLPDMSLSENEIKDMFTLDIELVEEAVAEKPMIGFHPDQVLIVKAKEGKSAEVLAQFEAIKKNIIENLMTYPANFEKQQATTVVSHGDYIALFLLGSAENNSVDEVERKEFAENEVKKAVDAFNGLFK